MEGAVAPAAVACAFTADCAWQVPAKPTSAAIESERKPLRSMLVERELIIMVFPISSGQASGERRCEAILRK
jgi:hypothetical protein